jgi:3-hydroxyisobutyrate dehydrogenase-like beta-hydroxyacid dehydrogenase
MRERGDIAMTTAGGLRVGFIGLGVMGNSVARDILKAGFPWTVRNPGRVAEAE